ncbi:hypothetical protein I553_6244 [Mycobacterium xenopi 4042]|uniref:Uncharacterized protein n=1 Tax=Mycobacterium xenopi 4042 TaxID=1299334 RepID=X8BEW4_MYCXE|nr:hypothetical protein I553_6244 [Mycobacterium xenopi 4042]
MRQMTNVATRLTATSTAHAMGGEHDLLGAPKTRYDSS